MFATFPLLLLNSQPPNRLAEFLIGAGLFILVVAVGIIINALGFWDTGARFVSKLACLFVFGAFFGGAFFLLYRLFGITWAVAVSLALLVLAWLIMRLMVSSRRKKPVIKETTFHRDP